MTLDTFYMLLALQGLFNVVLLGAMLFLFGRVGETATAAGEPRRRFIPLLSTVGTITRRVVGGKPRGGVRSDVDAETASPQAAPASHLDSLVEEIHDQNLVATAAEAAAHDDAPPVATPFGGLLAQARAEPDDAGCISRPPARRGPWAVQSPAQEPSTIMPSGESILGRTLAQMRRRMQKSA